MSTVLPPAPVALVGAGARPVEGRCAALLATFPPSEPAVLVLESGSIEPIPQRWWREVLG